MAINNNPLYYFKNIVSQYKNYKDLVESRLLKLKEKYPNETEIIDLEKGLYKFSFSQYDEITNTVDLNYISSFEKDFENELTKESLKVTELIESMQVQVLVNGSNQRVIGNLLLKELEQLVDVVESRYSKSIKFKEVIQDLMVFVIERFEIKQKQPKVIIQPESYNSKFEPKAFVNNTIVEKIYDIAVDEDLIDDVEVTFDMFFNSLTQKETSENDFIKFRCFNSKMKSFIISISDFFHNLKARSIEESGVFMTKQGTPVTIVNFDKTKEKEDYTKKLLGLLKPYLQ